VPAGPPLLNFLFADDTAGDTGPGVERFASTGLNRPATTFLRLAGTPLILKRDRKLPNPATNLFCFDGGKAQL